MNMIVLSEDDNVGIALRDIGQDENACDRQGRALRVEEPIKQGHKVALTRIPAGQQIVRFSMPIAIATEDIETGRLVHVHNVKSQYLNNDHDHYE